MAVLHQRFLVDGRVETPGQVIRDGAYREAKLRQFVDFTANGRRLGHILNTVQLTCDKFSYTRYGLKGTAHFLTLILSLISCPFLLTVP